jgi:hypothetical protein
MPRIDVSAILKLADDLEEQVRTLRSNELDQRHRDIPIPTPPSPSPPTNEVEGKSKDPYGIGLDLLDTGPPSAQVDQDMVDGCLAIKDKCQELEILARIAGAAAFTGSKHPQTIYRHDLDTSLINTLKQVRKCLSEIQKLYEELP